jgi:hypothetical protein
VPKLTNEDDISHFDPEFTEIGLESYSMSEGVKNYTQYPNFTFENDNGIQQIQQEENKMELE